MSELIIHEAQPGWPIAVPATTSPVRLLAACAIEPDGRTVSLWRRLGVDDEAVAEVCVWRGVMRDADTASCCHDWLLKNPDRLLALTAAAAIVSEARLDHLLVLGAETEREHQAEIAREAAAAAESARRKAAKASAITAYFRGQKSFRIELKRGADDEAFWSATFGESWERDRFWDWLRWQSGRFEEFRRDVTGGSVAPVALERLLLKEMLAAERAARSEGAAAGGRRPLRFWRGG